jgi:hypothetical protein
MAWWRGGHSCPRPFGGADALAGSGTTNRGGVDSTAVAISHPTLVTGLAGSVALLPLAWVQGSVTRRRVPRLPAAAAPHAGERRGEKAPPRIDAEIHIEKTGRIGARPDEQ